MKNILILFYDLEIQTESTQSIPRLLASVIKELETYYCITYFTFFPDHKDEVIETKPVLIKIKSSDRWIQKARNQIAGKKIIKEFNLRRKRIRRYITNNKTKFDVIIVLGLDEVGFLRAHFPVSIIIYWIHGISAIYKKEYLKHINKIDYLWSPTEIVYKKIIEELHPVPFLAEFQRIPNWAESLFEVAEEKIITEVRKLYNLYSNSKVFIFCGGNNKLKGWFLVKRALKKLSPGTNKCITVFVTGGAVQNEESYSEKIRIIYTGMLEPRLLSAYYHIADFGLFPSLGGYEHAPITLLEMINCNVLPISSDVGGIKEILGENYSFLIDTPHLVSTWIEKIEAIINLKEEEKYSLLLSLQKNIEDYKRPDFKQVLDDIVSSENA